MTDWDPDADLRDDQSLVRLADGAETLLGKYTDFLRGDYDAIPREELQSHVEETEFTADLATLEEELRRIVSRTSSADTHERRLKMDQDAAVVVREHVDISRSEAADSGLWSAFSMLYYPWFVGQRWEFNGVSAMKKKFWTQGPALDSVASTFERLWWIAELTREVESDGNFDYTPTRRAFEKRRFVFRVFDIKLGRYEPAVKALLEVLYDEDGEESGLAENDIIDGTVKRFRKSGAIFPYEGQTRSELVETLEGIRAQVEKNLAKGD